MIITSYWMLSENRTLNDEEIKQMLHGNMCRCTGYDGIVEAVKLAQESMHNRAGGKE